MLAKGPRSRTLRGASTRKRTQRQPAVSCRSPPADTMLKLVFFILTTGSLASAHAWSARDAISAVCVAWKWPSAWRGSHAAAEAPKAIPEENAGRGRSLVQMLSGAVLLFLIGGMPFVLTALHTVRHLYTVIFSFRTPRKTSDHLPRGN